MITCPECQQDSFEGTLYCPNCGTPLQAKPADEGDTGPTLFAETVAGRKPPPLVGKETRLVKNITSLRFILPSSGRQVTLPMQKEIRIGRRDERRGSTPELDLTADHGADLGVSRIHAAIVTTAQGIAIMDLDSVNGTRVNGHRIPPNLPFALNSGDELHLGNLLVHVFFEG
jgi:hypothetical protein